MLQVRDLSKSYGTQVVLDGVSFVVGARERVGVVGRNGHGKTTLFRLILGLETPDAGTVAVPAGYTFGHLSQRLSFTHATVREEAASALAPNDDGWIETYRADTILDGLGFAAADLDGPPDRLSGGFQVRLNLAKVLLSAPSMLLLDEPTNYLDITSMRWLERFLRRWRGELLLITHDRAFMDAVCTHTLGIWRRKVRKVRGGTDKLYGQIAADEEHRATAAANEARKREQAEIFIARFRAKATKARQAQSRLKMLQRLGEADRLPDEDDLDFRFDAAPFPGKRLLAAEGLRFSWPGGPELLGGLSLEVGPRDRIGIVGPNGRGKTTLVELLAGELGPGAGRIERSPNLLSGYFGQTNVDRLDPDRTVEEEVLAALPGANRGRARSLAGKMMFEGDAALKKVSVLSGGERARVLLARILARPANLLLLDEPTNHLDMESVDTLTEAVCAFAGGVVVVTHDEDLLMRFADRLVVFDAGAVTVFEGGYDEFLRTVGWSSEADGSVPSPAPAGADADAGAGTERRDRKAERRRRASEVQARSRRLRPLEKLVAETEARIGELEARAVELEAAIAEGPGRGGAGVDFAELAWELHDVQTRRDAAYETLERAVADLEAGTAAIDV